MILADPVLSSALVTAVVTLLIGLFGGGSLVALLRVGADKGKIVVEAAQGAVIVQTGVIDDLQEELARVKRELAELREREGRLAVENAALLRRVTLLERAGDGK